MSSSGQKGHWRSGRTRDLDNEDALSILNAVVEFRSKNGGSVPTPTTMKPVFNAVKGSLNRSDITIDQLYNKFRSLKHHYYKAVNAGVGPTPFDRKFYELSVKAWGQKRPSRLDDDDVAVAGESDGSFKRKKKSSKKIKMEENGPASASASASAAAAGEINGSFKQKKKSSKKIKMEEHGPASASAAATGEIDGSFKQQKKSSKKKKMEENGPASAAAVGEIDGSFKQKNKSSKKIKMEENGPAAASAAAAAAAAAADDDDDDAHDNEEEEEKEKNDVGSLFKYLTDQARKYWEMEGMPISSLELGLKFIDKTKAVALERRWRQHLESEMKILAKSFDANKDLNLALVVAGQKGANS